MKSKKQPVFVQSQTSVQLIHNRTKYRSLSRDLFPSAEAILTFLEGTPLADFKFSLRQHTSHDAITRELFPYAERRSLLSTLLDMLEAHDSDTYAKHRPFFRRLEINTTAVFLSDLRLPSFQELYKNPIDAPFHDQIRPLIQERFNQLLQQHALQNDITVTINHRRHYHNARSQPQNIYYATTITLLGKDTHLRHLSSTDVIAPYQKDAKSIITDNLVTHLRQANIYAIRES